MHKAFTKPGNPNCPTCRGEGYTYQEVDAWNPPVYARCKCLLEKDIKRSLDGVWAMLGSVPPVRASGLKKYLDSNLWVKTDRSTIRQHLSRLGRDQGPSWSCKVFSDADLITAWLANVALKGQEIYDVDARVSSKFLSVVDLVVPPGLLVLFLGIKSAPNKEMPSVFLEALQERMHRGKPTWIITDPDEPLDASHRCWSEEVAEFLSDWRVVGVNTIKQKPIKITAKSTLLDEIPDATPA